MSNSSQRISYGEYAAASDEQLRAEALARHLPAKHSHARTTLLNMLHQWDKLYRPFTMWPRKDLKTACHNRGLRLSASFNKANLVKALEEADNSPFRFLQLPAELKLMIIEYAILQNRKLSIRVSLGASRYVPGNSPVYAQRGELTRMSHPLLLVNSEIRSAALPVLMRSIAFPLQKTLVTYVHQTVAALRPRRDLGLSFLQPLHAITSFDIKVRRPVHLQNAFEGFDATIRIRINKKNNRFWIGLVSESHPTLQLWPATNRAGLPLFSPASFLERYQFPLPSGLTSITLQSLLRDFVIKLEALRGSGLNSLERRDVIALAQVIPERLRGSDRVIV